MRVRDLEVRYERGAQPGVSGVSFELAPGEGLLLTGAEGAGKTTVLRGVLGLVGVTGEATLLGGTPGDPAILRRVGYGPQGRLFAESHPPRRLVRLVATIRGVPDPAAAADDALRRTAVGRPNTWRRDIEEHRRTSLACALVGEPDLLVLDDPWEFDETYEAVDAARARGAAVLAASHDPGGLPALLGRVLEVGGGEPG